MRAIRECCRNLYQSPLIATTYNAPQRTDRVTQSYPTTSESIGTENTIFHAEREKKKKKTEKGTKVQFPREHNGRTFQQAMCKHFSLTILRLVDWLFLSELAQTTLGVSLESDAVQGFKK